MSNAAVQRVAERMKALAERVKERRNRPSQYSTNIATMMVSRNPRGRRFGKGASDAE